jgi:hypothetical protein
MIMKVNSVITNGFFIDPIKGATLGTVYFAFSCAFLFGWFNEGWERGFPRGREYLAIGKFILCKDLLLFLLNH